MCNMSLGGRKNPARIDEDSLEQKADLSGSQSVVSIPLERGEQQPHRQQTPLPNEVLIVNSPRI
jgi:hypothetical protein